MIDSVRFPISPMSDPEPPQQAGPGWIDSGTAGTPGGSGSGTPGGRWIAYPESMWLRRAYRLPIFLHRVGLGWLTGRLFMVLTTTGRKSGRPRRTAIEFHTVGDRKYVFAAWSQADWYRNLQVDPRVRVQTWRGAEAACARRVTEDEELHRLFDFASRNPVIRWIARSGGWELNQASFVKEKERWTLITFDPTEEAAPPALRADLVWIWPALALLGFLLIWLVRVAGPS